VDEFKANTGPIVVSFEADALGDADFPEGTSYNDAILRYRTTKSPSAVNIVFMLLYEFILFKRFPITLL